ncbi:MAG: rod-binding protein [Desulfobacterales bacterium]|nr:rod-binding protein [Desulfobacterales bacterium]
MEGIKLSGLSVKALPKGKKTGRPEGQQSGISEDRLKKACTDFESIFINYMLKTMRRTVPQSGTNFPGKDIYSTIVDQKVAEDLAKRGGGIGLQKILLRQLGAGNRGLED